MIGDFGERFLVKYIAQAVLLDRMEKNPQGYDAEDLVKVRAIVRQQEREMLGKSA